MTIVKFGPFLSTAEVSFWTNLAEKKLNVLKLSEEPLDITGTYSVNSVNSGGLASNVPCPPARLRVGADSLVKEDDIDHPTSQRNELIECKGSVVLLNTIESFKRMDKQSLLNICGEKIRNFCINNNDSDDLEDLLKFQCISFLDLKNYSAVYWFAFPAVAPKVPISFVPDVKGHVGVQSLSKTLGYSICASLAASVTRMRLNSTDYRCPPFFIALNLLQKDQSNSPQIRCINLSVKNYEALTKAEQSSCAFCFVDPCSLPENPGWPMRNLAAYLGIKLKLKSANVVAFRPAAIRRLSSELIEAFCERCSNLDNSDSNFEDDFVNIGEERKEDKSLLLSISLDCNWTEYSIVGWETNARGKMGPRAMNLRSVMDEKIIAEQSVDLNLKLMRWRLLPDLDVDMLARTKCLLLGAGTLGCGVARTLMAWGIRNITFVDNGRVSYSNPVRQSLFELKDCGSASGGAFKAIAAATALERIFPGVNSRGIVATIPMPGHPIASSEESIVEADSNLIDELIRDHDVIFLLTDTRESRWLPSVIAASYDKILINAALGLDSWLVMRHGCSPDDDTSRLGCYFCNDVVAPDNSMRERTLDQQCTVTRPGLAHIAAAMAVELMVGVMHDKSKHRAPANVDSQKSASSLGTIPHQIRGFLSSYSMMTPTTPGFDCCTACSRKVVACYREKGFLLVKNVSNDVSYLENLSGLKQLRDQTENVEVDWDIEDED